MNINSRGFGLIEVMVAMVLGLLIVLGITQVFVSSKQTYVTQDASAKLQEDARYVLARISQELRMAGMFGCLSLSSGSVMGVPAAFNDPIQYGSNTLSIITANVATGATTTTDATWTLLTDCRTTGVVQTGNRTPAVGQMAFPIRQVEYRYDSGAQTLSVRNGGAGSFQVLVSGVAAFTIGFGIAANAESTYASGNYVANPSDDDLIRSVRISMTLTDPGGKVGDQTYAVVAALRNRLL